MAKDDNETPTEKVRKRIGDYNPDTETGEILDGIANTDVEIASMSFERRNGKNGRYTLSIITLADGKLYHTGSPVVAERLAAIYEMGFDDFVALIESGRQPVAPSGVLPIAAKFTREPSRNDPTRSYWTVS